MSGKRKRYSRQFKLEAIKAYENGEKSLSQMERELGLADGLLRRWRIDFQRAKDEEEAFPGNGNMPESEVRIKQLERENARLKEEKEILKKVLAIYSKDIR